MMGFTKILFSTMSVIVIGCNVLPKTGSHSRELKVQSVAPDIYWATAGGWNCGFIVGSKGVVVIDTTISTDMGKKLLSEISKITPKPVTTVILTHACNDHIGGLKAFPLGVKIIAHENTKKRMESVLGLSSNFIVSPDYIPNQVITRNKELIEAAGVKIELYYYGPAHTDADIAVYLPDQKIIFTGDLATLDQPVQLIKLKDGGSALNWILAVQKMLELNADKIVVGHGDVQTKESLKKLVDAAAAERDKIKEFMNQGMSLRNIQKEVGDPPSGQRNPRMSPGGEIFMEFSEALYIELKKRE